MSNVKPIMFSGPMVRAILDGRKTQTRRVHCKTPCRPVGTYLWVRETWNQDEARACVYRADGDNNGMDWRWRPSIFMPRWASRITLRVTDVRLQELQEITEEDARAEGAVPVPWPEPGSGIYREGYSQLWDSINYKRGYGWLTNPLVWAYTFERVEGAV